MKKIFIITGEYSGDIHAGKVLEMLKRSMPDIAAEGIGGENLKSAGAKIFCDHSKMSGFGLNFKMIVDHLSLEKKVADYILNEFTKRRRHDGVAFQHFYLSYVNL